MNAAERLDTYAKIVEMEASRELPQDPEPDKWPLQGKIDIKDLQLFYLFNFNLKNFFYFH